MSLRDTPTATGDTAVACANPACARPHAHGVAYCPYCGTVQSVVTALAPVPEPPVSPKATLVAPAPESPPAPRPIQPPQPNPLPVERTTRLPFHRWLNLRNGAIAFALLLLMVYSVRHFSVPTITAPTDRWIDVAASQGLRLESDQPFLLRVDDEVFYVRPGRPMAIRPAAAGSRLSVRGVNTAVKITQRSK